MHLLMKDILSLFVHYSFVFFCFGDPVRGLILVPFTSTGDYFVFSRFVLAIDFVHSALSHNLIGEKMLGIQLFAMACTAASRPSTLIAVGFHVTGSIAVVWPSKGSRGSVHRRCPWHFPEIWQTPCRQS